MPVKFVDFLKGRLIFNIFYCFSMFANKLFTCPRVRISQKSKMCFNVKSSTYYCHMKTKILGDFQICIKVRILKNIRINKNIRFTKAATRILQNFLTTTISYKYWSSYTKYTKGYVSLPLFIKYSITSIITQFIVINTVLLTELFCNCPLFSNWQAADL